MRGSGRDYPSRGLSQFRGGSSADLQTHYGEIPLAVSHLDHDRRPIRAGAEAPRVESPRVVLDGCVLPSALSTMQRNRPERPRKEDERYQHGGRDDREGQDDRTSLLHEDARRRSSASMKRSRSPPSTR